MNANPPVLPSKDSPDLLLSLERGRDRTEERITVHQLIIAGWTGRNQQALQAHIDELVAQGVAPPKTIPTFYRVSSSLLTTRRFIQVRGTGSTGEAECVLLNAERRLWVGVGSDHTDRKVEAIEVTLSKQACPKPISPRFWDFAEVSKHWDDLILRSYALRNGERILYQEGNVGALRPPGELLELYAKETNCAIDSGTLLFCGTLPLRSGFFWTEDFTMELEDPVLGRTISHSYALESLPICG